MKRKYFTLIGLLIILAVGVFIVVLTSDKGAGEQSTRKASE